MQRHAVVVGASLGRPAGRRVAASGRLRRRPHHHRGGAPPSLRPAPALQADPDRQGRSRGPALRLDADLDAEWQLGIEATGLDLDRRLVDVAAGDDVPFDGSSLRPAPTPEPCSTRSRGPGVHYLRTVEDAIGAAGRRWRWRAGPWWSALVSSVWRWRPAPGRSESTSPSSRRCPSRWSGPSAPGWGCASPICTAATRWMSGSASAWRAGRGGPGRGGAARRTGRDTRRGGGGRSRGGARPPPGWIDPAWTCPTGCCAMTDCGCWWTGSPGPDVVAVGDVTRWRHPGYRPQPSGSSTGPTPPSRARRPLVPCSKGKTPPVRADALLLVRPVRR